MSGRIRFLADANLDNDIVVGLKRLQPDIDFQLATDAHLRGLPDDEVLAIAAQAGRILVSHDRRAMPRYFADFLATGQHSAGVILVLQQGPMRDAIESLLLVWRASEPEEWVNRIDYLPWH